jgi:hypothetical protein
MIATAESVPYLVIIMRRGASELLLSCASPLLPRLAAVSGSRLAEQLVGAVRERFGLQTYCLRTKALSKTEDGRSSPSFAIMEVIDDGNTPDGMIWTPADLAASMTDTSFSDGTAIRSAVEDLNHDKDGGKPFSRPGWLPALFAWVENEIRPLGLRLTGRFEQLNSSPTFSLLRIETTGRPVWFKATGEPNAHERPLSIALARLLPAHVPRIIAVHPLWNGWLAEHVTGVSLDQTNDIRAWERTAQQLAELQISSIEKAAEMLAAGLKDLRIAAASREIDSFLARMGELMALQVKPNPAPLGPSELATLGDTLKTSCQIVESFGLPATIGHLDFNPGNILLSEERCVFLDWAEGALTHPLVTFEYLREHLARSGVDTTVSEQRLITAYLRPWSSFYAPEQLKEPLRFSPLLAVFIYAVASGRWRERDLDGSSSLAGCLRSLTRRMHREATRVHERRVTCPA